MKIRKYNNNKYIFENILCLKKNMKEETYLVESVIYCCLFSTSEYREYSEFYLIDDILELNNNIIVSTPIKKGLLFFGI